MTLTPAELALAESMYAMFSRQIAPPLNPATLSNAQEAQTFHSSNKDSVAALIPVSQFDEE